MIPYCIETEITCRIPSVPDNQPYGNLSAGIAGWRGILPVMEAVVHIPEAVKAARLRGAGGIPHNPEKFPSTERLGIRHQGNFSFNSFRTNAIRVYKRKAGYGGHRCGVCRCFGTVEGQVYVAGIKAAPHSIFQIQAGAVAAFLA